MKTKTYEDKRTRQYPFPVLFDNFFRNLYWWFKLEPSRWYAVKLRSGSTTAYLWDGCTFHTATRPLKDHMHIKTIIGVMPVSFNQGVLR